MIDGEEAHPAEETPAGVRDDLPTVAALAVLAFIAADVAHEVVGHGVPFLALGGRSFVMTTTRLIGRGAHFEPGRYFAGLPHGELYGRLFSLGGPLGNLACAALAWLGLRSPRPGPHRRLFLWLVVAFNLFWGIGYMIYSGVLKIGDWMEGVRGLQPPGAWRLLLFALGVLLYQLTLRLLGHGLGRIVRRSESDDGTRVRRLVRIAYWSGGVIACAGALFDPHGSGEVFLSAAPSSLAAAIGLFWMPAVYERFAQPSEESAEGIARSRGWIVAALLAAAFFVFVLGPGIPMSL